MAGNSQTQTKNVNDSSGAYKAPGAAPAATPNSSTTKATSGTEHSSSGGKFTPGSLSTADTSVSGPFKSTGGTEHSSSGGKFTQEPAHATEQDTASAEKKPDIYYTPDYIDGDNYGSSYDPTHSEASAGIPAPDSSSGDEGAAGDGTEGGTSAGDNETTTPEKSQEEQLAEAWKAAGEVTSRLISGAKPDDIDIEAIDKVDISALEKMLEQIKEVQEKRTTEQIDYAVRTGEDEVNRAVEDAAQQFQTQRDQIAADEARALDNQALYAEARGDRGGIGQAQYGSIQNNAATNRYTVNQQQTKLSTDAARQIADLRAKGEFDKADSLLQISQNYLSELKALEQWALQTNLGVDEFNKQLEQWKANYNLSVNQFLINAEMSAASLTGAFSDGTPTMEARAKAEQQLANAAQALFQLGIPLTDEQIAALGWTKGQYTQYLNEQAVAKAAGEIDRSSLPIYWTNEETGRLERISGKQYRDLLNGNVVDTGSSTGTAPTADNDDSAWLDALETINNLSK